MSLPHLFSDLNSSNSKITFHSKAKLTGVYYFRNQASFKSISDSETSEIGKGPENNF